MTKGIRVAKAGADATRGAGKDLAFTSEAQSLKLSADFRDIIRNLKVDTNINILATITHTLKYAPVFRLFVEAVPGSGKWYNDSNALDNLDDISQAAVWKVIDINENNILIFFALPAAGTYHFKYWLFEDRLREL